MPTTDEILAGATEIASKGIAFAAAWHIAIAAVVIALIAGFRPTERAARSTIPALLLSASVFATAFKNPFNSFVLVMAGGLLIALAQSDGPRKVRRAPAWQFWVGGLLVIYGAFYPHFLGPALPQYLYAAPVGLIPCPSLSVAIGFGLIGDLGRTNRAWGMVLAIVGAFYGLYGMFELGVMLDAGLLLGSFLMAATTLISRSRRMILDGAAS
jgi:hypothetical protein